MGQRRYRFDRLPAAMCLLPLMEPAALAAPPEDEVRAIVAEMLADAETRAGMSAAGSGYDNGFVLRSEDGNYRLQIGGVLQFRYNANRRDDSGPGTDDFDSGFTTPRSLLIMKGHAGDPALTFQIRLAFRPTDGTGILDDAFVGYQINDRWSLRFGQGLAAFSREWYYGDLTMQTVERSPASLVFGEQRMQFVELKYQGDDIRTIGTFSDGFRSGNTDFTADPADWAVTGRAELKLAGDWKSVSAGYSGLPGSELAASIGGALHFEQGARTSAGGPVQDLLAWTADVIVKGDGWNLFGAATGYHTEDEAGVEGADFDEYGLVGQGGFFVSEKVELFARYSAIIPDGDRAADNTFDAVAFGLNWFIRGQAARFTIQAEWFFDPTTGTTAGNFANTGGRNPTGTLFGILPSAEEDQVAITAQFQLFF